jgi:hypothetical protein
MVEGARRRALKSLKSRACGSYIVNAYPNHPNRGRPSPNTRDITPVISSTPRRNMARAVTISDKAKDNVAEVTGFSRHTATTEMVLQESKEATSKNGAATARVNASVLALGLRIELAAVSTARTTHATIAAIPAIPAKRAILDFLHNDIMFD